MEYMMRTTRNVTSGDSTGKNFLLIWKTLLPYSHIEDVYDSKIVFTFDHRLLCFIWP